MKLLLIISIRSWLPSRSGLCRRKTGHGLLFRLVNYAQPATIVDAGMQAASSLYLKAAKEGADYTAAADLSELFLESGASVDFLYLHDYRRPEFVEEVFRI